MTRCRYCHQEIVATEHGWQHASLHPIEPEDDERIEQATAAPGEHRDVDWPT